MPKYVNPIPMIDMGKTFEMRLELKFDDIISVEEAKQRTAAYLLEQTPETLASWLHCTDIKAVYPNELKDTDRKE